MVLHMHWSFAVTDSNTNGSAETNINFLFHRPFFYLLWAGTSHVNIFFVMSGYVLSASVLRRCHEGSNVYESIASAVFRRAVRIFLPAIALLFIYAFALQLGIFNKATANFSNEEFRKGYQIRMFESLPPIKESWTAQLWDVMSASLYLVDPTPQFDLTNYSVYDTHLWTIPTEYFCSIALYAVLLATCRLFTVQRLICHTALVFYCWLASHQTHALFFAGMTIAELDLLLRHEDTWAKLPNLLPTNNVLFTQALPVQPVLRTYLSLSNILCTISTILGLYLLSMPLLWAESTPSYDVILTWMPTWMSIGQRGEALRAFGALLTVWPITYCSAVFSSNPIIEFVLANPISAYLGRISFAMYLLHGFVIRSLGYAVLPWVYEVIIADPARRDALAQHQVHQPVADGMAVGTVYWAEASEALSAREVAGVWLLGYVIVLPVTVWTADLFWRGVDLKCIALARWLEEKMVENTTVKEEDGLKNC